MKPNPEASSQNPEAAAPAPQFICPYCGADENGAAVHQLTHHANPPLTVTEAKAALAEK